MSEYQLDRDEETNSSQDSYIQMLDYSFNIYNAVDNWPGL